MAQSTPYAPFQEMTLVPVTDERGVRFPYTPPLLKNSSGRPPVHSGDFLFLGQGEIYRRTTFKGFAK
jgi:hypothetical protein